MKTNIQLNFFDGLYDSPYESSDTEYYAIHEEIDYINNDLLGEDIATEDDFEFNYNERHSDIVDAFTEAWKSHAPEVVLEVSNPVLDSPKYYNFRNDEIYADVELADNWQDTFTKFMEENHDWLKQRISDDWTSYDGFASFMSNDIKEWSHYLFEEQDKRYIGVLITYMMLLNEPDIHDELIYETMEDIYDSNYIIIVNKDLEEKIRNK